MVLTREFIQAHKTTRGEWTRKQLEAIGVECPPPRGWIDRAVGREISDEQAQLFVAHLARLERLQHFIKERRRRTAARRRRLQRAIDLTPRLVKK